MLFSDRSLIILGRLLVPIIIGGCSTATTHSTLVYKVDCSLDEKQIFEEKNEETFAFHPDKKGRGVCEGRVPRYKIVRKNTSAMSQGGKTVKLKYITLPVYMKYSKERCELSLTGVLGLYDEDKERTNFTLHNIYFLPYLERLDPNAYKAPDEKPRYISNPFHGTHRKYKKKCLKE